MSWGDDWLSNGLPTFEGGKDRSAARQMIEKLGGPGGFKTVYQNNPDGSVTYVQTKGTMPPQVVTIPPVPQYVPKYDVYMETGQLEWDYVAPLSPTRYDAAKWHFLDIASGGEYLGKIKGSGETPGVQLNIPALSENCPSLAVGYPITGDSVVDATTKDAYGNRTYMKKMVAKYYPPSLFSGKLRLFMQAQYGAQEESNPAYYFDLVAAGLSYSLNYNVPNGVLQFGVWAHLSPGIFTTDTGEHWLINIANSVGSTYTITAYPFVSFPSGASTLALFKQRVGDISITAEEQTKLEAYLFASCFIDVSNPTVIGTFTGANGSAMAYGWKWTHDGSKASIVVHDVLGTGVHDYRFSATTMHLQFAYASGTFTFNYTSAVGGEWADGWGTYNILVPEIETVDAPLALYSVATDANVMPPFSFSGVPVYGWYKDGVWTPIMLDRAIDAGPFPLVVTSDSGMTFLPGMPPGMETKPRRYTWAYHPADSGWSSTTTTVYSRQSMTVSCGTFSLSGTLASIDFYNITETVGEIGAWENSPAGNFMTKDLSASFTIPEDPPGYAGVRAAEAAGEYSYQRMCLIKRATKIVTESSYSGLDYGGWALVIPCRDAEALYIATRDYGRSSTQTYTKTTKTADVATTNFNRRGTVPSTGDITNHEYVPYTNCPSNYWYGDSAQAITTDTSAIYPDQPIHVFCFNSVLSGEEGTPGGEYRSLFAVSRTYPYYDRGMYFYTSYGGRYIGSEGVKFPESVKVQTFVGWA